MIAADKHVIRRTTLEVNGSVQADAFRFQQEVTVWARDYLLPELDRIFASLPSLDETILIDRLEFDLSSFDISDWSTAVLARLKSELASALANRARSEKPERELDPERRVVRQRSFAEKLAYYLDTGVLPWSLAVTSRSAFEAEVEEWLTSSETRRLEVLREIRQELAQVLKAEPARARFLASFSEKVLRRIFAVIFEVPEAVWEKLGRDIEMLEMLPMAAAQPDVVPEFPEIQTVSARSLVTMLLREFVAALAANAFVYTELVEVQAVTSFLVKLVQENRIEIRDVRVTRFQTRSFQVARDAAIDVKAEPKTEPTPAPKPAPLLSSPPTPTTSLRERAAEQRKTGHPALEGIFIQNAGLILLAPFLPTLLARVDLASKSELKDPGMAMALMHYLACGQEGPAEFQVVLPKILCGWDIEKPVELPATLPDVMKEEAGQLLVSAIEHWSVLKDTSPEGLQEAFLSRPGKISLTSNNDWLLQVEQKAFDMLIQHLPWNFKLVKLPWMQKLIHTEWID